MILPGEAKTCHPIWDDVRVGSGGPAPGLKVSINAAARSHSPSQAALGAGSLGGRYLAVCPNRAKLPSFL